MSFHLNDKAEAALVSVITPAAPAGTNVYPGKRSGDLATPCVICAADGEEEEDPKGTGNFFVSCAIQIKRAGVPNEDGSDPGGPDPIVADQALVDAVFGAVMVDNLATLLTAAVADFTVFPGGVFFMAPTSGRDEAGFWIDELVIRLYCCGSDIAA